MTFEALFSRLTARLRLAICNGETTERAFARRIGLSQPHLHNVLAGSRRLTQTVADRILDGLGISVEDLLTNDEKARSIAGAAKPPQSEGAPRATS